MPFQAPQIEDKPPEATRTAAFGFLNIFADSSDYLTGTPIVAGVPEGLVIAGVAYNTATISINGVSHGTAQAIICTIARGLPKQTYRLKALAPTTNLGESNLIIQGDLDVIGSVGYVYGSGAMSIGVASASGAGTFA